MDTAGYFMIVAVLVVVSLLWQLNVDFYRPWCRARAERIVTERREHEEWIIALQRMNDEFTQRFIPVMRQLCNASVSAEEATRNLAAAMRGIGNATTHNR